MFQHGAAARSSTNFCWRTASAIVVGWAVAAIGFGPWAALAQPAASDAENQNDDILERWTPGGDANALDLPYRHRYADYERESDDDWIDARWQQTDWGPFVVQSTEIDGQPLRPKNATLLLSRDKNVAAMFDLKQCGITALVAPAQFQINPRRFGLLHRPKLQGDAWVAVSDANLWMEVDSQGRLRGPAPAATYRGLRLHDWQVLLSYAIDQTDVAETVWLESDAPVDTIMRQIEVGPSGQSLAYKLGDGSEAERGDPDTQRQQTLGSADDSTTLRLIDSAEGASLHRHDDGVWLHLTPREESTIVTLAAARGVASRSQEFADWLHTFRPGNQIAKLRRPGPRRWGAPLFTAIELAEATDQAYVADEIGVPFINPHQALFFTSSLDFFEDGTIALCTAHGDVWVVRLSGPPREEASWQRFATGLYQPLGIQVVDGKIVVLGRDQLTRLHDENGDGEADYYESFNNDLQVVGQDHAFAMRLERDANGNFYFLKSGNVPYGSALYRLSPDGASLDRYAIGFRHPFGMGVSPTGEVTVADNEGNWVPSSKIDLIKPGGFYGFVNGPDDPSANLPAERPLCYLPKAADNASGGQVWATSDQWGDYQRGKMLHFSWGRGTMHAVLEQQVGETRQAATVAFDDLHFLSGPADAEFHPLDGQLYVVGMDGWTTAATQDGCLTRVRYTGGPTKMPTAFSAHGNGFVVQFSSPLNPASAAKRENYRINQWNYRRSSRYGSFHYRVSQPEVVGHEGVAVERAELLPDGRSVFLRTENVQPVDQLHVHVDLFDEDEGRLTHDIYATVHAVAPALDSGSTSEVDPWAPANLTAWCIVPFDAAHRGPAERAAMLKRLGIGRVAYDWRDEHTGQFDEELAAYEEHDIELTGFWTPVNTTNALSEPHVKAILAALERNQATTQLWVMLSEALLDDVPPSQRVAKSAAILKPLAERARDIGCHIGLYNHGGWFGNVAHQVQIIQRLERDEVYNVGIVYNMHHGHGDLERLDDVLTKIKPYLYALNLNGMRTGGPKILPVGQGDNDLQLMKSIRHSGYAGPIGILDHRPEVDAAAALQENLAGLEELKRRLAEEVTE